MAANDNQEEDLNVFGERLAACSIDPATGFYRNGCCSTDEEDRGLCEEGEEAEHRHVEGALPVRAHAQVEDGL